MLTNWLLKYCFRIPEDWMMPLGPKLQKDSIGAIIYPREIWKQETLPVKLKAILRRNWEPSDSLMQTAGKQVLLAEIFGTSDNYADQLMALYYHHLSTEHVNDMLTPEDTQKAGTIQAFTILTRQRFKKSHYVILSLNMGVRFPMVCFLSVPMAVKIPIISLWYYVDIDYTFAFHSIRKSNHPEADALIAYLYDIILLQQKTAISFHEYIRLIVYTRDQKKNHAILINAEVDALREMESIIVNLKASVEKIVSLLGLTHNIRNLADKKTHAARMQALIKQLPKNLLELPYWYLIEEYTRTDNLEDLNNLRSGLLHKKGLSKMQPHQYIDKEFDQNPFMELFHIAHEQHAKNTAVLLCTLAILTDKLVTLDPPTTEVSESLAKFVIENMALFKQ